jgi:hypothetical protein
MIAAEDMAACRAMIRTGSLSFHAASRLLPARVRDPALALYAFCRVADDDVDEGLDKAHAVLRLRERLDLIYAGRPEQRPSDRAFAAVVQDFDMPRALPDALLEGLAWDAMGRRYRTLSELHSYSARVAAAVGVMMCVLMPVDQYRAGCGRGRAGRAVVPAPGLAGGVRDRGGAVPGGPPALTGAGAGGAAASGGGGRPLPARLGGGLGASGGLPAGDRGGATYLCGDWR